MKRYLPLLSVALVFALACNLFTTAPPPARTAVPTWTLPFSMTTPDQLSTTAAGPLPGETPDSTPAPTNTLVVQPDTLTPSPSPTARPGIDPTLGPITPDPYDTPVTPVPPPMPQLHLDKDIVNILLLGRDTARGSRNYRTDVMIIASINKAANSVTLLTIPRDLYVYIPGWTMNRLNTAAGHGDAIGYPGGGVALLEQTILYNFGIPIHGWARIDFDGFKQVVDTLGGVDIPVSCAMQDWRLKDPTLDPQNADNWQLYTVPTGVQHMDGDLALWYSRSRKHSSDFDRSRRQHQMLRAIFDKGLRLNMLTKVPELYAQYTQIVDTDLNLGDLLQFVPMATQLDRSRIKSRFVGRSQVFPWITPAGADVLLPDRDAISKLLAEAFQPPSENVLAREAPAVEIWNGTPNADWAALAADNLEWAGIRPVIGQADTTTYATTVMYDYTTSPKGSARNQLEQIFHLSDANVIAAPNANAPYPFRIILGSDYNSCVQPVFIPHPTPTPATTPSPTLQGENIIHAAPVLGPPPGMDGDLTEWTFLVYPVGDANFGQENWQGADDLSALWNIAWDEDYLYIAIKIKDDKFVQQATGENIFKGDSLELWLDTDRVGDAATPALNGDDFQLGLSPGDLTSPTVRPEAYLWFPQTETRSITGAVITARLAPGGYNMEVAVPWTIFHVAPTARQTLGFALNLNDNDAPGTVQQQTQVSNRKDQKLADPTTWGILVLDPPPGS